MGLDDFARKDIEFHRATAAAYDAEITATYGVYHRYLLEPYLDRVAARVGSSRALDLGCGTGVVSIALAERGFEVLGIDHSEHMLAFAKAKAAGTNTPGSCRFIVGDVRHIPAGDEEYDCVTCQGLLHHLPQMNTCLSELNRVLRPGGFFYISEPTNDETPLKRALRHLARIGRFGRTPRISDDPESVEAPIDPIELRTLLENLGFSFEMEFLTHLRPLRRRLSEPLYVLAVRAVSAPWRKTRGDLVFVFGQKPGVGRHAG